MKKKLRRREGRKVRKRRRLKKWLATEACEEMRLINKNLWDSLEHELKPYLALALSRAIDPMQLKYYLSMTEVLFGFDDLDEIKDVMRRAPESSQITTIINNLEVKSLENDLPIKQVASEALYDCVGAMLEKNRKRLMPWVEFGYGQLESWEHKQESEWFLSSDVSVLFYPELGDLMKAIGAMRLSSVLIDFVKWDDRVRHHIASELEVAPGFDYINFNYSDPELVVDKLSQEDWVIIWRIIFEHLPINNHYKINILLDIDKQLNNDDIEQLVKDFDLKPV